MTSPQVLIAEDEGQLRNLLAQVITQRGIVVMQAVDGVQAFQLLKDNPTISVLLSDVRMPRMDGYQLVVEALTHNPELKVVMMTGYPGEQVPPAALKAREIRTLHKPFDAENMCDRVVDMLSRP